MDWNEDDFGELNFYDMFDLLYPKLHNEKFPYVADDNLGIGAVYHIPKTEFENVIMEYFNINSDKLQKKLFTIIKLKHTNINQEDFMR